jgi:two-component system, OmpR family, response regulator
MRTTCFLSPSMLLASSMLVLVIEDDPEISHAVRAGFERAGHEAHCAADGESGLRMATSTPYDAVVVDLMLPGVDGLTLIETMRARGVMTPIIVLSAKRSTDDKVTCLKRGADDYLAKPFDMPELLARVEAVLRRSQPAGETERLEAADVVLDLVNRTARRGTIRIELTPREFSLLELLIRNEGRPLSKFYLIERLWNYKFAPQTNLVDVLVCRLRNNIDRDFPVKLIHTVRGIGYVFRAS